MAWDDNCPEIMDVDEDADEVEPKQADESSTLGDLARIGVIVFLVYVVFKVIDVKATGKVSESVNTVGQQVEQKEVQVDYVPELYDKSQVDVGKFRQEQTQMENRIKALVEENRAWRLHTEELERKFQPHVESRRPLGGDY